MTNIKIETFEEILEFTAEAIENGYNYSKCMDKIRDEYNLSSDTIVKIQELMEGHNWEEDNQYVKFEEELKNILL